jgi:hypothetical protein
MANSAYNDSDDLSFPVNIVDPWNNLEYTYNDLIGIYDDTTRTVRSSLKPDVWNDWYTDFTVIP